MKVLTVGCSFTYGEELSHPGSDAWPAVLAGKNVWEVNNQGKGGGSNDRSVRVVFEEIDKGYDLIIVAWTVPDRFEVPFNDVLLDINVNSGIKRNLQWATEYYAKHYDRFYSYTKWLRNVIMLQSYLKSRNQKYIFVSTFGMWSDLRIEAYQEYSEKLDYLIKQVDKEFYVDWPQWGMTDWMGDCPKGPNGHPLQVGHQQIAIRINEHIRNLGWLS
jgi:hypothetical protein